MRYAVHPRTGTVRDTETGLNVGRVEPAVAALMVSLGVGHADVVPPLAPMSGNWDWLKDAAVPCSKVKSYGRAGHMGHLSQGEVLRPRKAQTWPTSV